MTARQLRPSTRQIPDDTMENRQANQIIQYIIDRDDQITYVSEDWWFFAEENEAGPDCYPPQLLGRTLWDFIAGEETRQLYRIMINKARSERKSVQIPIRCDSPELRREIMISLKSVGNGHIEFLCRTMQVETREPVDLLRRDVKRADSTIRICSFCKKIATPSGEWIDTELAIQRLALFIDTSLPQLSHGLCPSCHTAALADL